MTSLHLPLPTFTAILLSDAAKCLNINVQVEPSVNSPHSPKRDLMKTFDDRFLESYSEYDEGEMNAQDDNDYYARISPFLLL
ncbi:hypothetical protein FA15DRAFT_711048 [Coprinopsis marcescibilis]|uniref:Uncharacterized protein n=1 Tax=Coprinopsis marcescibilis TaxID=230819 RepID=A0A5C3KBA3_COPMA|nr:hypothetical protein FA15DRAFT_711048 [Coprinopsis marcescibilis]